MAGLDALVVPDVEVDDLGQILLRVAACDEVEYARVR